MQPMRKAENLTQHHMPTVMKSGILRVLEP
jgi:hypothetical protein